MGVESGGIWLVVVEIFIGRRSGGDVAEEWENRAKVELVFWRMLVRLK